MLPPCSATNVVTAATMPRRSGQDTSSTALVIAPRYQTGRRGPVCDDGLRDPERNGLRGPERWPAWHGRDASLDVETRRGRRGVAGDRAGPVRGDRHDRTSGRGVVRDSPGTVGRIRRRRDRLDVQRRGYPAQPAGVPWPTQDWPIGDFQPGFDTAYIDEFLTWAFDPPEGESGASTPSSSCRAASWWSSTTATLGSRRGAHLVVDGEVDHRRCSASSSTRDGSTCSPRRRCRSGPIRTILAIAITIDRLLHMRSGLDWIEEYAGTSDVIEMLFGEGKDDRAHFAAEQPLAAPPGEVWNYSTGTSMILSRIIADHVGYGEEGTQWAQDDLFGPLGITSVEHDLDATGVMSGGSAINMTALDFARFGLLNLRGGNWDGDQIVP